MLAKEPRDKRNNRAKQLFYQNVYDYILDLLLTGELVPGDVIDRQEIADTLGVSRTPVQKAVSQLESEGFLTTYPRKGTVVKSITKEDVYGHLLLREALECEAVRIYCRRLKVEKDEFIRYAKELDALNPPGIEYTRLDMGFHKKLIDLVGNEMYSREFSRVVSIRIFYGSNTYLHSPTGIKKTSHLKFLRDIMKAAPEEAVQLVRKHVSGGKPAFVLERGR